jgi:L-amino acid N-acyltransferase YncA
VKGSIRPATTTDADAIAGIYGPFVRDTVISFEIEPPTATEMERRIAATPVWLVYESCGSVLGYAYAVQLRPRAAYAWSAGLSIYVDNDSWGGGVGRALLTEVCKLLVAAGFVNAFAGITLPNARSVTLFELSGFLPCGLQQEVGFKLGAWHDVGWWQRRLRAPSVPPPPRLPDAFGPRRLAGPGARAD